MKTKPTRHKESNTFKFQPFSERIAALNVDVFHFVNPVADEVEGDVTHLQQAVDKWSVQNGTVLFDDCLRELPEGRNLAQLLYNRDKIVGVLLNYIDKKEPLSLQPLLELLVAVARDLRHEFYIHFPTALESLFALISTSRDPDILEWSFQCIAYLLKFLWRSLLKDPARLIYERALPLLQDSKPSYIREFAAQCFAFVARKVKDPLGFIAAILSNLKDTQDGIPGTGRLLCETLCGVSGQFHSTSNTMLLLLLQSLGNPKLPGDLLLEVLTHSVTALTTRVKPANFSPFWITANAVLKEFTCKEEHKGATRLLKLMKIAVEARRGQLLSEINPVVKNLVLLLSKTDGKTDSSFKTLESGMDLVATLLCAPAIKFSQEQTASLTSQVLATSNSELLLDFIGKVISCPGFELHILPRLLLYCKSTVTEAYLTEESRSLLKLFAQLILQKSPPCHSGLELPIWKIYPLDLSKSQIASFLLELLENPDNEKFYEELISALIIIPHVKGLNMNEATTKLTELVSKLCKFLTDSKKAENTNDDQSSGMNEINNPFKSTKDFIQMDAGDCVTPIQSLFMLSLAIEAAVHLNISKHMDIGAIIRAAMPYCPHLAALRILDLVLTSSKLKDATLFHQLMESQFHHNLSNPYYKVRILSSHILSLLEPEESSGNLFRECLEAENTPATIEEYRDRLQKLQALEYERISGRNSYSTEVALHCLIGNFYVNFKLLWEPVSAMIASHALGQPSLKFWRIFGNRLKIAAKRAKIKGEETNLSNSLLSTPFLIELHTELETDLNIPDHSNFRIQLWNTLSLFPEVCAERNRDIAVLFLSFLQEEYFTSEASDSSCWDVVRKIIPNDELTTKVEDIIEPEIETELEEDEKPEKIPQKLKNITTSRTLQAQLTLFSKLRNPRGMHREIELKDAYHELLKHGNPVVQRLALDCIMTYKPPFLLPYKDHLYGLLEEKSFKAKLVMFRVDTDSELVQNEHRPQLIPILMRILFSKMQSRSSKTTGHSRRTLILRFLSGCKQEELIIFLELAFKFCLEHYNIGENPLDLVHRVMKSVDLHKVIPPKRLNSYVNLANVVLSHLGRAEGGMHVCTALLLRIILIIAAQTIGVLLQRDQVSKSAVLAFRGTKKIVIDAISKQFVRGGTGDASTIYCWSLDEIDSIFEVAVWPSINALHIDSIVSSTALLRLFITWSENPRYFKMLVKYKAGAMEVNPLTAIMKLLNTEGVRPNVTSAILDLCLRLLTLRDKPDELEEADEEMVEELPDLAVNNLLPIDYEEEKKLNLSEPLNYGSRLLLPHVPSILSFMHHRALIATSKKKAKGGFNARDLSVLAAISELVSDPISSLSLLKLLIPLSIRKAQRGSGDSTLGPLLSTTGNLMRCIDNPKQFTLQLIPLFSLASGRNSRHLICSLLYTLLTNDSARTISDLNSWDPKRIEEPDFDRRINAFTKVTSLATENTISLEFGLMVIHSCYFSIKTEKDLSLRDCATHCLQVLCPALAKKYASEPEVRSLILERTVMEIIRRGLRDKNESVQHEMLALLGVMVRECGDLHPTLRDLLPLTCPSDLEMDFFENMRHLQLHRRSRALLRFTEHVNSEATTLRTQTLTQIILPLASSYLCCEKYAKINSLVDAAIESVGTVCSLLPWPQYEVVLKYHLARLPRMLDYQKQLVRTVVAILDAFHFDLSSVKIVNNGKNKSDKATQKGKKEGLKSSSVQALIAESVVEFDERNMESLETESMEDIEPTTDTKPEGDSEMKELNIEETEHVETEEEELATILENTEENMQEVVNQEIKNIPLSIEAATKIRHSILYQLLPRLNGVISARHAADFAHKVNKTSMDPAEEREREAQEVLRVPIALAVVKLLQKLPHGALDQNLNGVILKVCMFFKSRLESTRRAARETLNQILRALGPAYLRTVLSELSSLLTRGYLVHVLVYTVHSTIVAMGDLLRPGDIDSCLKNVLNVCQADLFGETAEEKEVAQIAGKVKEARSHKSYDTLHLLAKYITESCLTDLLLPLKDVISTSHSYKMVKRATVCLQKIVQGLSENTFISPESLLTFAYGASSESLSALLPKTSTLKNQESKKGKKPIQRTDTFLITPAPKRSGPVVRQAPNTNAHLFVVFGVQLLHFLLKRDRINHTKDLPVAMLDPFINILAPSLKSQHIKLTTMSLQCLAWLLKLDLPSLHNTVSEIAEDMFALLHKYSGSGQGKGENFDLAMAAFKTVSVLVKDVEYYVLTDKQQRLLLLYAERDIHDSTRQATTFTLLKSILNRRLISPELPEVLRRVAELAVTSELHHVREQSRQVFLFYLLNYPLGKEINKHLRFLFSQLNFSLKTGRISALEMLQALVNNFPPHAIHNHGALIFVTLSPRLVNDEDPECRKMVAQLLQSIIGKLEHNEKERMFGATLLWLKDKKPTHKELAAQIFGIFVAVEGSRFGSRLPTVLPIVTECICPQPKPGQFVRAPKNDEEKEDEEIHVQGGNAKDHLLYQLLQLLIKVSKSCSLWMIDPNYEENVKRIGGQTQVFLCHAHEWVRLASAQFLGCIFACVEPSDVAAAMMGNKNTKPLLIFEENSKYIVKSLILDLCDQLCPGDLQPQMAEQVMKNLVYLARILKHIPEGEELKFQEEDDENQIKLSLVWMARRMRKIVNLEISKAPKSGTLRTAVLKWLAAVCIDLGAERLSSSPFLLYHLLAPVIRETSLNVEDGQNANAPSGLRRLATEVSSVIREQIGIESFARATAKLQGKLSERRSTRKRQIAQEAVTEPERAAKRKIKKQLNKREFKKRKINKFKGKIRKNFRDKTEELDF